MQRDTFKALIVSLVVACTVWLALPAHSQNGTKEPALADVMAALVRIEAKIDSLEKRFAKLEQGGEGTEADKKVRAKLKEKLDVTFEQNQLVHVMEFIRKKTEVNIFTDWVALEAAGVEQDMPINLELKQVTAEQVIKLVVARVGSGGSIEPLAWDVCDGVVMISTEKGLAKLRKR